MGFFVLSRLHAQVVGFDEIMEMLTNYEYTIDYILDAGGAAETWGAEAGYGIISASQMLRWVELNCSESCSGEAAAACCQHEVHVQRTVGSNIRDTHCDAPGRMSHHLTSRETRNSGGSLEQTTYANNPLIRDKAMFSVDSHKQQILTHNL